MDYIEFLAKKKKNKEIVVVYFKVQYKFEIFLEEFTAIIKNLSGYFASPARLEGYASQIKNRKITFGNNGST